MWRKPAVLKAGAYTTYTLAEDMDLTWRIRKHDHRLDKKPWPLSWLVVQRFDSQQLMYFVLLKSLWVAILGTQQGWGKLKRTGSVKMK